MESEIYISKEERERAWQLSREKYELDLQSKLVYAERKGREEGETWIIELWQSGKSLNDRKAAQGEV